MLGYWSQSQLAEQLLTRGPQLSTSTSSPLALLNRTSDGSASILVLMPIPHEHLITSEGLTAGPASRGQRVNVAKEKKTNREDEQVPVKVMLRNRQKNSQSSQWLLIATVPTGNNEEAQSACELRERHHNTVKINSSAPFSLGKILLCLCSLDGRSMTGLMKVTWKTKLLTLVPAVEGGGLSQQQATEQACRELEG